MEKSKEYYRNRGKITTQDLKLMGPNNTIYINDELTNQNKYLLGKTKQLRNYGFKFIWFKNGRVLIRKDNNTEVIWLKNEDQLNKIFESVKNNNVDY